jgi:hypothetical protein
MISCKIIVVEFYDDHPPRFIHNVIGYSISDEMLTVNEDSPPCISYYPMKNIRNIRIQEQKKC